VGPANEPDAAQVTRRRRMPAAVAEAAVVLIALFLALVAGAAGWAVGHSTSHTHTRTVTIAGSGSTSISPASIDPHVAAGAHDFSSFACAQCHGDRGRGGVSPDVPALSAIAHSLTPSRLRHIIDHGLGESKNPTKPYMPVWGEVISAQQVSDLIAYLRAGLPSVPTAEPPAVAARPGPSGRRRHAVRSRRLHQLPRAKRTRRGSESTVA
jgi:mono/diheme cytochrome c family protein